MPRLRFERSEREDSIDSRHAPLSHLQGLRQAIQEPREEVGYATSSFGYTKCSPLLKEAVWDLVRLKKRKSFRNISRKMLQTL